MKNQVTKFFNEESELPEKANCLWLIKSGTIKSYTVNQENKTVILGYWGQEDVVGRSLSKIEPYFLQCVTDVRAILISASEWESLSDNLLNRVRQTQELSCIVRSPQQSDRLWLFLVWLGNKFGKDVSEGIVIDFNLTTQDLSDALGINRLIVSEILDRFQTQGLISRSSSYNLVIKQDSKPLQ